MSIFNRKKREPEAKEAKAQQPGTPNKVQPTSSQPPVPGQPHRGFFGRKPKENAAASEQQPKPEPEAPVYAAQQAQTAEATEQNQEDVEMQNLKQRIAASQQDLQSMAQQPVAPQQKSAQEPKAFIPAYVPLKKPSGFKTYLEGVGANKKGLENALRNQGIKTGLYEFVRNMFIAALSLGLVLGATLFILFNQLGLAMLQTVIFSVLIAVLSFYMAFQTFLNYPTRKSGGSAKSIERDILFAARDMIISLRSGMPLFNAITSISSGYGEASKEFAKIVERVQLGTSLEDAIDQTVSESKSVSFRRIMLQAAVSIRAGADVVGALQSVIDQVSQERIIELRRYGQRLNAIAMFYMLFGIIMPSMGIAVVTILTTFIAIFTVNVTVLEFAIVGIIFLQIVFLKMITSSRPVFTM